MPEQTDRNPVEVLAEEFIERKRQGEQPTVAEYVENHRELADEIRQLFPTIVAMERVKNQVLSSGDRPVELRVDKLEQLGDYRILREISRGGMGIVYEAEQQSLGRRVAVKVFPRRDLGDSKHLRRFRREARTAALLHHTNIVQVFGVGEQDGLPYFVMQFIRGIGLDKVIKHLKGPPSDSHVLTTETGTPLQAAEHSASECELAFTATDAAGALLQGHFPSQDATDKDTSFSQTGGLGSTESLGGATSRIVGPDGVDSTAEAPIRDVVVSAEDVSAQRARTDRDYWWSVARIGVQISDALRYAHAQGTYHRDIKPGNLLLDAQGTVWVTDFGLAKAVAQEQLSQTGDIVGTLRYMAPEQLDGQYDARSDIYSLGLTLYELLTLRPAYVEADQKRLIQRVAEGVPTPPRQLRRAIPRDLETIVLKAIARDPKHRYQAAADLSDDLQRFLDDRPICARRVGPVERFWRWSRRNPAVASLSTVLLLVVLGSFAVISGKWREAENENRRAEANLSLALDSMDQFLQRLATTWMAHPSEPQIEDGDEEVEFHMVVSDRTATILQDALKFYDQFALQNAQNPRLRRDTAKAHRNVGDIHERLGQYGQAEYAYRKAAEIYEEQLWRFPDDPDLSADVAATHNQFGMVRYMLGDHNDARSHFSRARQILTEKPESSPKGRYELARTCSNLGKVLWWLYKRDDAADNHRQAIELLDQLVEENPQRAEYRLAQARAYRGYYPFVADGKRRGDSTRFSTGAISILEELIDDFPNAPDYQCELSETLEQIGSRSRSAEDSGDVDARIQRAVALARPLTEEYPRIPRYRAALARALRECGSQLRRAHHADEAEPLYAESVVLYRSLVGEFPSVLAYQFFLAIALNSHGDVLRDLDRFVESRQTLEMAIVQQQRYLEARPNRSFGRSMLARHHESLAETLRKLGDDQSADRVAQEAKKLRAELDERSNRRRRRDREKGRSSDGKNAN